MRYSLFIFALILSACTRTAGKIEIQPTVFEPNLIQNMRQAEQEALENYRKPENEAILFGGQKIREYASKAILLSNDRGSYSTGVGLCKTVIEKDSNDGQLHKGQDNVCTFYGNHDDDTFHTGEFYQGPELQEGKSFIIHIHPDYKPEILKFYVFNSTEVDKELPVHNGTIAAADILENGIDERTIIYAIVKAKDDQLYRKYAWFVGKISQ